MDSQRGTIFPRRSPGWGLEALLWEGDGGGSESGGRNWVGLVHAVFPPKDEMIGNVLQFGKSLDGGN